MNRKKLRIAFALIVLVLTGAVFTSVFLSTINGDQVRENILLDLSMGLVADDHVVHDPIEIRSDADFVSQGWAGSGTPEDPYRIEGLSIDGVDGPCIWIENTRAHFLICDCFLYGAESNIYPPTVGAGVYLKNASYGQLANNRCTQNYYGIHLVESSNNSLSDNRCPVNTYGIYLRSSNNNTLTGNDCSNDNTWGIYVRESNHIMLANNTLNQNHIGIKVEGWEGNFVYDCVLINNTCNDATATGDGIILRKCISSTVMNNTVANNFWGVLVEHSMFVTLANNTIIENSCGVKLDACTDISVVWNTLINDFDNNAWDVNGLNFFDYNYWSGYAGSDDDGDGIGDIPYGDIGSNIIDNHPLMYPPGSEPTTTTTITTTTTTTTTTTPTTTTTTTTTDEITTDTNDPIPFASIVLLLASIVGVCGIIALIVVIKRK